LGYTLDFCWDSGEYRLDLPQIILLSIEDVTVKDSFGRD
jgi:hypothetical protein